MRVYAMACSAMSFRSLTTTVVLIIVYGFISTLVFVSNELPPVPTNTHGLHFDQAFSDLQTITTNPHPYNSHANDVVREYVLARLKNITSSHPYAHLDSDLRSTAVLFDEGHAVYFEGSNILVKIDGSDPDYRLSGGVLFSAHFDSVPTAPGASDDGIGIATLMAMVRYFLEVERPQRTVVFNFNNGEEDGLYGAHAYLEHPWSSIPSTFLNVDSAAAGGRPMIFRSTSITPLAAFAHSNVPHPHANVLAADAFARGLIRSSTDYEVYQQFQPVTGAQRMQGVDLALYKHRAFYHTKYDSVPGAGVDGNEGAAKALWAMMEVVRGGGVALAQVRNGNSRRGSFATPAVYFDLFASRMILFPLSALLTTNIVLLIVGPVIVVLLQVAAWGVQWTRARDGAMASGNGNVVAGGPSFHHIWQEVSRWLRSGLVFWLRFWVMLVVVVGLQVGLVVGYLKIGYGYVVHSSPYLVLISAIALAHLSTVLILSLPSPSHFLHHAHMHPVPHVFPPADAQKNSTLLQTYILTWLFLVVSTIAVGQMGIGGLYAVSAWNMGVLGAVIVGAVEVLVWGLWTADTRRRAEGEQGLAEGEDREHEDQDGGAGATEHTPLLRSTDTRRPPRHNVNGAFGWWFVQLLLVVPVPVILVSHLGIILLGALPQTVVDGSSPIFVYAAISLLAVLLILPLAPFAHNIHRSFTYVIFAIFVLSTVYAWTAFPFTMDAPLKVRFQQSVHLTPTSAFMSALPSGPSSNHSSYATYTPASAHTSLTGLSAFLESRIVRQLPSASGKYVNCTEEKGGRVGMRTCTWEVDVHGEMAPNPGTGLANVTREEGESGWLTVNTTKLATNEARITVRGVNTRVCGISFTNGAVSWWKVLKGGVEEEGDAASGEKIQDGYEIPAKGASALWLYSRTWGRDFVVDVGWDQGGSLNGRVACQWAEYESGRVGTGDRDGGKIPALEEVLKFIPLWAVVTGRELVEGWAEFSL